MSSSPKPLLGKALSHEENARFSFVNKVRLTAHTERRGGFMCSVVSIWILLDTYQVQVQEFVQEHDLKLEKSRRRGDANSPCLASLSSRVFLDG